jgi:hypothetical protein
MHMHVHDKTHTEAYTNARARGWTSVEYFYPSTFFTMPAHSVALNTQYLQSAPDECLAPTTLQVIAIVSLSQQILETCLNNNESQHHILE